MGVVLPFTPRPTARTAATTARWEKAVQIERTVQTIAQTGADRAAVLAAAEPLMVWVRHRYGFAVMRDGLPEDPDVLATALVGLLRGLMVLDADVGRRRALSTFGVYFGRETLAWFDDGYGGSTALAVPNDVDPAELARFVRPRLGEALF